MDRYRWGVVVLMLASVTDLLTTFIGVEHFGLVESNTTPATLLQQGGYAGLIQLTIACLGIIIGLTLLLRHLSIEHSSSLATVMIVVAAGAKTAATGWNTWLILTV